MSKVLVSSVSLRLVQLGVSLASLCPALTHYVPVLLDISDWPQRSSSFPLVCSRVGAVLQDQQDPAGKEGHGTAAGV